MLKRVLTILALVTAIACRPASEDTSSTKLLVDPFTVASIAVAVYSAVQNQSDQDARKAQLKRLADAVAAARAAILADLNAVHDQDAIAKANAFMDMIEVADTWIGDAATRQAALQHGLDAYNSLKSIFDNGPLEDGLRTVDPLNVMVLGLGIVLELQGASDNQIGGYLAA